jgi:hypothetical protein
MMQLAVPILFLLWTPAQEEPAPAPEWAAPICNWINPAVAYESILELKDASLGSAWWLRRFEPEPPNEAIGLLQDPGDLVLIDGSGNVQTDFSLHISHASIAITVPSNALPGATYLLRKADSANQSQLLRATTNIASPFNFELVSLAASPKSPEDCSSECFADGFFLPWSLFVDLEFQGDPVVADIWFRSLAIESELYSLEEERIVDSLYLSQGAHDLQISTYFDDDAAMSVRVELRSPHTLELLHEEAIILDPVPRVPFAPPEEERFDCEDYEDYYQDDIFSEGDCYCSGLDLPVSLFGSWALVWLLLGWLPRRLRQNA